MLNLREYQTRARSLCDYLPWAALVADGVMLNKDGSFLRVARYRGPDLDSATPSELVATTARINNVLRRLGSGWSLFFEAQRIPATRYPVSQFPDAASWIVDKERELQFNDFGKHFESIYTLSLVFLPPSDRLNRAADFMFEKGGDDPTRAHSQTGRYQEHLSRFLTETTRALDLLAHTLPDLHVLDSEALLTYLHGLISTKRHRVSVPEEPTCLDSFLSDTPVFGGLSPMLGDKHIRTLTITGFPNQTVPGILDDLNDLGLPYRWVTRWIPFAKQEAEQILRKIRRQWFVKRKSAFVILQEVLFNRESPLIDSDAGNKAADADMALQELGSDDVSYGAITSTVTVLHEQEDIADDRMRQVERVINAKGFVTIRESLNAVEAWLGSMPGHVYANVRKPIVHSLNLAHMMPISAVWAGEAGNTHLKGPPLLVARTRGATPYRLNLHVGDVGHTLVIGPTGAGKSVLLSLLALQFRRYNNAQVFMFDKGRSARAAILAMGGESFDLSLDGHLSFQPLAAIDKEAARAFASQWVADILTHEGLTLTPEMRQALWSALNSLAAAPVNQRTLTGLSLLLQMKLLRQALHSYTMEGAFGGLLDADTDSLSLNDVLHFEMEDLLNTPQAVLPLLTYLFHRLDHRFDGRPTLLILDEAWIYLDTPFFAGRIREWLKTLRKKNVSVVFATQSLSDIGQSSIAPTLIESCPTRIFLPNDRALEPQIYKIYEQFGLNDRQITLISQSVPKCDYYLQSARGNRQFELGLGPVASVLCGSSSIDDHGLMDQLLEQGSKGFLPRFLAAKGLDVIARQVDQLQQKRTATATQDRQGDAA